MTSAENAEAARLHVLYVAGELDAATAPDLRSRLGDLGTDPTGRVVVDLSGVTFMSCSGLRPLVETQTRLGERFRLRHLSPAVTWLLELTLLDATFSVVDGHEPGRQEHRLVAEIEKGA